MLIETRLMSLGGWESSTVLVLSTTQACRCLMRIWYVSQLFLHLSFVLMLLDPLPNIGLPVDHDGPFDSGRKHSVSIPGLTGSLLP